MTNTIADPLVGRTIAQYEIVARVGGGAMGVVYQARDTKLGRLVALKFLPQQWSHDDAAKQRFVREAQAASATHHPNICTIHDIETADDGQLFIVMAFYEGPTLKQRLESGPIAIEEALEIATEIAEGLAKAHAQGVVHRDIKPGNVILTEEGVRILDFGLATFVDALKLTAENASFGTPAYMSPEQVRGQTTDARSDVWAVGVVLYEMLAGRVPFQGSHAEAIAHAVRHEAPEPLRAVRPEIAEEIEQLVFRALHKEPSVRFQHGRALARALRQVRGLSLPLELRTEPVSVEVPFRPPRRSKRMVAASVMIVLAAIATAWSIWTRADPTQLIIAPLINVTGVSELEPYRLALTHTLSVELNESANVRVLPYVQMLGRIRRFISTGADVSSPEAIQALTAPSRDALVLVPSLLYENDLWRGRVEIRSAATGIRVDMIETDAIPSPLPKDVAYDVVIDLADRLRRHFSKSRWLTAYSPRPPSARLRTLDAAQAFEQGVRAYDELEYATARSMFGSAAMSDPANPMPLAWLSRVSQLMRQPNESREAAERALRLVNDQTPRADGVLVAAMTAEARRDHAVAISRYRELGRRAVDDRDWLMELGGFFDRSGQDENAVGVYQEVLALDSGMVRPHLELCRLYSPSRLNQAVRAEEHGRRALAGYRLLGDRVLEAQALFCLTDVLRMGDDAKREEGRVDADAALRVLQASPGHAYNLARAYNYAALAADAQRRSADALALWEKSLAAARKAGNTALEPLVLMNLGVTYEAVGNRALAFDHYQQSIKVYEDFGDTQRAAQSRANVGSILIENSGKPDEGLRYIRNVLPVFRLSNNKDFELFCLRAGAWYYRNAGLLGQAEIELKKAIAIATASGLSRKVAPLEIDLARSVMDRGDYGSSRAQLVETLGDGSGPDAAETRIRLAAVQTRLGELEAASINLVQAGNEVERSGRRGLLPVIHLINGELAYESGSEQEARRHFSLAAAFWTDGFPDPASVEARAYIGLLDGLQGKSVEAERALRSSLEQAKVMNRVVIQARVQLFLARLYVRTRRGREAVEVLTGFSTDSERILNPELLAQAHYWRSRARLLLGDPASAQIEADRARGLAETLRAHVPEKYRSTFATRPDIRSLLE